MAQVERLELLPKLSSAYNGANAEPGASSPNQLSDYRIALELTFPLSLDQQQEEQIKTLLKQVA
ncbi:MAG: hypothetical protein AAF151_22250 [Cyanobacteria bacterium J06656_5]